MLPAQEMLRIYEEDKPQQITSLCYEMCSDGGCGSWEGHQSAWGGCVKAFWKKQCLS